MGNSESSDISPKNAPFDSVSTLILKKLTRKIDLNALGGTQVTATLLEQSNCIIFIQNALYRLDIIFRSGIIFKSESVICSVLGFNFRSRFLVRG